MNIKTIEFVEAECLRFLDRLNSVKAIEKKNDNKRKVAAAENKYVYTETGTRKHGAMRRAALDLKEALTLVSQNREL